MLAICMEVEINAQSLLAGCCVPFSQGAIVTDGDVFVALAVWNNAEAPYFVGDGLSLCCFGLGSIMATCDALGFGTCSEFAGNGSLLIGLGKRNRVDLTAEGTNEEVLSIHVNIKSSWSWADGATPEEALLLVAHVDHEEGLLVG